MIEICKPFSNHKLIFVLSYNILASSYSQPQWFPRSNVQHLEWSFRSKLFEKQFINFNADLICIQEMQESDFHKWLSPFLDKMGYNSLMFKKQRDVLGNFADDGTNCATFYKRDRFELLTYYELDYSDYARKMSNLYLDEAALGQFALPVHNVAIFCHLLDKDLQFRQYTHQLEL